MNNTTYMVNGERVTLSREGVARNLRWYEAEACRQHDPRPSHGEYELGWERHHVYAYAIACELEAERLRKVLACIDAGMPELPAELCAV